MSTISKQVEAPIIDFNTMPYEIGDSIVARLPEAASKIVSSRGQAAVTGTINGHEFKTVLEPDGDWGHWIRINADLQKIAHVSAGDTVDISITQTKDWPEPIVPVDLANELQAAPQKIQELWKNITPMARWEWVRWVNATNNRETRARRVEVSISKMKSGKRRPCCFNLAACTDPQVSKNGRLIEPEAAQS